MNHNWSSICLSILGLLPASSQSSQAASSRSWLLLALNLPRKSARLGLFSTIPCSSNFPPVCFGVELQYLAQGCILVVGRRTKSLASYCQFRRLEDGHLSLHLSFAAFYSIYVRHIQRQNSQSYMFLLPAPDGKRQTNCTQHNSIYDNS